MKINTFFISLFASIFVITACSNSSPSDFSEKISLQNGVFEIDVLPGSFATTDCGVELTDFDGISQIACVAFPLSSKLEKDKNWDAEYLTELDTNGWKWAGGEGNAYYLEKPQSSECSYSLTMMGWLQGSKDEVRNYFNAGELGSIINQTYIFGVDTKLKCGDDRNAEE